MSFIKKHLEILLILAGIAFAIFAFAFGAPLPDYRDRLTKTHEGINWIYRQNRAPTDEERKAGSAAIRRWRSAGGREKSSLANEIVLSKVLIGLTQQEIVEYMGTPDAFGAIHDVGPHIRRTGYNAIYGESQCDLIIELNDDGKASEVYLDVNY
ncbi:MAG: hypothetical protein QG574_2903 [Cyanobacteriota bacterium erpe_2018_sw_21hr_WHONDRS-SW48-000092_B_bin.40]|jgi:hypothetical protein|nr:hypothetical protein [Cyanobacteriota bacterium erpe_2018_sw_21hr_WHONDRS-SW48-000092_B_bin.40]